MTRLDPRSTLLLAPLCLLACAATSSHVPMALRDAPPAREAPGAAAPSRASPLVDVNTDADLDTDGTVAAESPALLGLVADLRREVYRLGGKLTSEVVDYSTTEARAKLRARILPKRMPELLEWISTHTTITDEHVRSQAASEPEIEAAVAREEVAERLRLIDARLAETGLSEAERRSLIEERTYLAGGAEAAPHTRAARVKRVATLAIELSEPRRVDPWRDGSLLVSARGSVLGLGVLGGQRGHRLGVGLAAAGLGSGTPNLELIGYAPESDGGKAGLVATVGLRADASRWLGRTWLVPFAGLRLGYGYVDRHAFVVAPELGVELFRTSAFTWSASVRTTGLIGGESQLAVEAGTSVGLVF